MPEIRDESVRVIFPQVRGGSEYCLDLGSKQKTIRAGPIVKGLDADPVPGEQESLLLEVQEGEGEHPVQLLDAGGAAFFVQVDDDFGIGVRLELVAFLLKLSPQFAEVIDLAVEHNPDGAVLVAHRLPAGLGEVNDGQARVTESDRTRRPAALECASILPIRAAMAQDIHHRLKASLKLRGLQVSAHDPADAAHGSYALLSCNCSTSNFITRTASRPS